MNMHARFQMILTPAGLAAVLLLGGGCVTRGPHDQVTRWIASEAAQPTAAFPAYHLRRHGDLAAGTLARGGEMVLDGLYYYQCATDGAIEPLPPSEPLAEGWAVRFRPDRVEVLEPGCTREQLEALLKVGVPDRAMPCAFRLVGRFEKLQLASGKTLERVSGSLFGVRFPGGDRDGPGAVSCHFLSGDWLTGGRVEAFRLIDGSLAIDLCPRFLQVNPAVRQAVEHLRR